MKWQEQQSSKSVPGLRHRAGDRDRKALSCTSALMKRGNRNAANLTKVA